MAKRREPKLTHAEQESVLFARLTRADFKALEGMRYSGSTGPDADYPRVGSYVATYARYLMEGLVRLRWKRIRIRRRSGQWIVTQRKRKTQ